MTTKHSSRAWPPVARDRRVPVGASGLLALVVAASLLAGCPPRPWRPAPPRGQSWAYDSRGTYSTSVGVATGTIGPVRYGLLFAGSRFKDTPTIRHPDRFWTRQDAASFRFNSHLGSRGERVQPGADGPQLGPAGDPAEPAPPELQPQKGGGQ